MDKTTSMSLAAKSKTADYEQRWRDGSESYPRLIGAASKKHAILEQLEVCKTCFKQEPSCIKINAKGNFILSYFEGKLSKFFTTIPT